MSYLEDILSSAQGGQLIANLADRFGLTPEQMDNAVKSLAPALEIGIDRAADDPSIFEKLIGALISPDHQAAYDASDAHSDNAASQSRALLSDLFGSSAAASQVVQVAARESGLRPDILSQLLPVLASVLLGGLFKNMNNQGLGGILGQLANSGALGSILEQALGGGRAAPQPEPMPPTPRSGGPGGAGGGLGGLLGGILGSLLGGGRRRSPMDDPMGGQTRGPSRMPRGNVDDTLDGQGGGGLPEGLDQAAIQQAIEQIKNQLQVGRSGNVAGGAARSGNSDLESLIGQMFGRK